MFHEGVYLLILWHLWLFGTAILLPSGSAWSGGPSFGHIATALSLIGGGGIVFKRVFDEELSSYYLRIHHLKWLLILLILAGGLRAVVLHFDPNVSGLLRYVRIQATFQDLQHKLRPALAPASHVFFASFLLLYLPFSHILRISLRYYQHLRWDEVPKREGSTIDRKAKEQLNRPVNWSAPDIKSGQRWGEVTRDIVELWECEVAENGEDQGQRHQQRRG